MYVVIWERVLSSLTQQVLGSFATSTSGSGAMADGDEQFEDLNVEHAQLLLFLFHSLALMQKKQVGILTLVPLNQM